MAAWGQGGTGAGAGAGHGIRGRVAPRDAPALQWAGAAVLLYALVAVVWIGYEAQEATGGSSSGYSYTTYSGYSFKALYDPRESLTLVAQTHYDWAFLVAALVVGALALGRRRVARGGLALLAALLICLCLREVVGLMASDEYGDRLTEIGYGKALLTFRFTGLVLGCVLWAVVARTRGTASGTPTPPLQTAPAYPAAPPHPAYNDAPPPPAYAPYNVPYAPPPGTGRRVRPGFVAAGVALLLCGGIALGWLIYILSQDNVYFMGGAPDDGAGEFFRAVADASRGFPLPHAFYNLFMVVAPLLVAVLLLAGRPAARGAALALACVSTYFDVRALVPAFDDGFDQYWDSTVGTLGILTPFVTIPLQVVVVIVLLTASADRPVPGPYGAQPSPSDWNRHR
ncbi:hypothetical protein GCM10010252_08160 [Streptomyces aureoverticillatus]|nr:hypothetical protein GCM10010252_08160 [Streptomyces aureoverticillatus]